MLTVSVVTFKTDLKELERCLNALLQSEVVLWVDVIDNGNEPERIGTFCQMLDARVRYQAHQNVGYGGGHNVALRMALTQNKETGEPVYHLVMNSDVYFSPGVLEYLYQYMEAHPDVGQVIPNVFYPDGVQQYVCRLLPTPADVIFRRFLPPMLGRKRDERYTLAFTGYKKAMNVPYHMGCFMFLRVSALREVGLFDERFFMYPEDIDLTRRMHRKYRTMFQPDVFIIHDHRAASYKSWRMLWIHIVNMCRYFNKWGWWCDAERTRFNGRLLDALHEQ